MTPKTTQRLHSHPIPTSTGPVDITTNHTAEWVAVSGEIPFSHLRAVAFALLEIDKGWRKKTNESTTRKRDNDSQTD